MTRQYARFGLLAVVTLVFSLSVIGVACQTYEFNPVTPLTLAQTTQVKTVTATSLKPNVMLLVDKSGSMNGPINPSNPNCPANCGNTSCPANCPTRISELRSAMDNFLTANGTLTRLGLAFFPTDATCGSTTSLAVALPDPTTDDTGTDTVLAAKATDVKTKIDMVAPNGGTPTGDSLNYLGTLPGLNDNADLRADYIVLLTDGLPNCNASNPNNICACGSNCTTAQTNACNCTTGSCTTTFCAKGCLDQDGSTQVIANLKLKGIQTIVVGFGADTAGGVAATTLTSMAKAGGVPRQCPNGTNAECGSGNTCDTTSHLCSTAFYQASSAAELSDALAAIWKLITDKDICKFLLQQQPSDPSLLSVIVNGVDVPSGPNSWTYSGGSVEFGANTQYCTDLKNSNPQHPVKVEIRIVEKL